MIDALGVKSVNWKERIRIRANASIVQFKDERSAKMGILGLLVAQ